MAEITIERQIILSTGEDFSALTLTAILHQLREYGQVAIHMQGGKVPGVSRIAHEVLSVASSVCVVLNDNEFEALDKIWQDSLV
jgi:hypothetical protein